MIKRNLALAVLTASLLLLSACAGAAARTHVLWPAVVSTWPAVNESIQRGLDGQSPSTDVAAAVNQIEGAVRADDYQLLTGLRWFLLEPIAWRGVELRVQAGEISEGVSVSLMERINKFSQALQELIRQ